MMLTTHIILSLTFLSFAFAANNFAGITASNAIGGKAPYTCRTQADWNNLAHKAKSAGFKAIRILDFDCSALTFASKAAASAGLKVLAGIYFDGPVSGANSKIDSEVGQFQSAVKQFGANRYMGLSIGNENTDDPNNIIKKVNQVRSRLRSAGINTPVSTVHTWVKIRDAKVLCSGDFVGANAHAFYDGNTAAANAGKFLTQTVLPALRTACGNKKIMITETGWPSRGGSNGAAVASIENERTALVKLNCASANSPAVSVFAFEYDDQTWKSNANEQSFGIFPKFNNGFPSGCGLADNQTMGILPLFFSYFNIIRRIFY